MSNMQCYTLHSFPKVDKSIYNIQINIYAENTFKKMQKTH